MTVYLGLGVNEWLSSHHKRIVWLRTAPIDSAPFYPPLLDLAESVYAFIPNDLTRSVYSALALTWEELKQFGLTDHALSAPTWNDVLEDSSYATEQYLIGGLAEVIASLGSQYGVVLYHPEYYDYVSLAFTLRLLHEAQRTGLHIAIESSVELTLDVRYQEALQEFETITQDRPNLALDVCDRATQLVSICPHGIPLTVLKTLGIKNNSLVLNVYESSQDLSIFIPAEQRQYVLSHLSEIDKRNLHAEVFDAWNPGQWGYIRRAGHAIAAGSYERMLAQHTPYFHGFNVIGRDFIYRQFAGLSLGLEGKTDYLHHTIAAHVGAARLAPRVRDIPGFQRAIYHYRQALDLCTDSVKEATILFEVANIYAVQRHPEALVKARRWYKIAYQSLPKVSNPEERLRIEVLLNNGLALVEYHEKHNQDALILESHARSLVKQAEGRYPRVERWATLLLNMNTATLLEKRFADIPSAMILLEENIRLGDQVMQEKARIDLSRLCFDQRNYDRVVELLSALYECDSLLTFDEEQELFGRSMFAISLLFLEQRERSRCQGRRLKHLAQVANSPSAVKIIEMIQQA